MNTTHQWPNRSEKNHSTSFLIWFISGLYLLGMVWFLLSTVGMWLMSAVVACTGLLRHSYDVVLAVRKRFT